MWTVVLYRKAPIDFSTFPDSDGEPVAKTRVNFAQAANMMYSAELLLDPRGRFVVGGNQFIYYDPADGRRHVAPDVYVALDVEPGWRAKWETWEEGGRFPDIVMEFISPSTQDEDLRAKVALYGELGAREYYIYDPAQVLDPPLRAYRRAGARLVAQPLSARPDSAVYSPALGAELRVVGRWLRLINPATGQPVPIPTEDHAGRLAAEERARREEAARHGEHQALLAEQQARAAAEEHALLEEAARQAAEQRAGREEAARQAAEERAQHLQAQLAALLAEQARREAEQ